MSILATSPSSTRHFDMNIAAGLGDINAAVIVQQLDYWLSKEGVGVVIDGTKFVYNTFVEWVNSQFKWLSVWQFRKAMSLLRSLRIVKVIRYKATQWNQTNYYTLDRDRLIEYLKQQKAEAGLALATCGEPNRLCFGDASFPAESIEMVEMCATTDQGEGSQTLEMRDSTVSYIGTKSTSKEVTTKQSQGNRQNQESTFAAASPKTALEEENNQKDSYPHSDDLTSFPGQIKQELKPKQSNPESEHKATKVDDMVNKDWKELIPLVDSTGILINRTIKDLLKLYPSEKVESALALVRARKREQYIPNPSGYFVSALKGDWGAKNLVSEESGDRTVDKGALFRHWYDLSRELGYCSGQEVRDEEQWVCLSGSWEKWSDAVNRGYSLDYLKTIMKRNQRQ